MVGTVSVNLAPALTDVAPTSVASSGILGTLAISAITLLVLINNSFQTLMMHTNAKQILMIFLTNHNIKNKPTSCTLNIVFSFYILERDTT